MMLRHQPRFRQDDSSGDDDAPVDVIGDYARLLERKPGLVLDELELPHPKLLILAALLAEIVVATDREAVSALAIVAKSLANFQPGIGPNPWQPPSRDDLDAARADVSAYRHLMSHFGERFDDYRAALDRGTEEKATLQLLIDRAIDANPNLKPLPVRIWRKLARRKPV